MSLELSASAIQTILAFPDDSYRQKTEDKTSGDELHYEIRKLCLDEYSHRLLKQRLILQDSLNEKDVQDIFALGHSIVYDGKDYPRLLVPTVVEAFRRLTEEPPFLDITVSVPTKKIVAQYASQMPARMDHPTEIWPQVYGIYQPCEVCTSVEESSTFRTKTDQWPGRYIPGSDFVWTSTVNYAVEKFHVSSKHFKRKLLVELHFTLGDPKANGFLNRNEVPSFEEKIALHKVTMRLADGICKASTKEVARKSKTMILNSDFASEVYGFVKRVDVGTSLIANRGLSKLLVKLRYVLPVHRLKCKVEKEREGSGIVKPRPPEDYWLVLHHFRRDLKYYDVRRFKIPSAAGPMSTAAQCAMIRRQLSNSDVSEFSAPPNESRLCLQMLAALVDRNVSMGRLRVRALGGPMADCRLMDAVLRSGMRLRTLDLWIEEDCLQRLIKTTDFLRMPVVQRLSAFELRLVNSESSAGREPAVLSFSLWTAGIYLLRNCARYEVDWGNGAVDWGDGSVGWPRESLSARSKRHLELIARKLVQICEKFESGEVSEIVGRFVFYFPRSTSVMFPFNDDNEETVGRYETVADSWLASDDDKVYRFRNAVTDEWLTAGVVRFSGSERPSKSCVYIEKDEARVTSFNGLT